MFTSKDVARVAGVSQSTVSYVMSGKRPISDSTRRRVLAAIEELTYQPNAGARALASQRTQVVGLVVPFAPGADTSGLLPFIESITACAREHDHEVLLVTADEGPAGLTRLAGRALCDAIVLMDLRRHDERVAVAAALRVPVILIGVPADPMGLTCVDVDFAAMARMAVAELAQTRHDRLVLVQHASGVVERGLNFVARFTDAAREAAELAGVPLLDAGPADRDRVALDAYVDRLLARLGRRPRPVAGDRVGLLVPNSAVVQPLLLTLAERGLQPGRDLSVIGVTTDDDAEQMHPALTNVSLEPRDVSRRAMERLFRLVDRDAPAAAATVELVRPHLTRRQTVMPPPA